MSVLTDREMLTVRVQRIMNAFGEAATTLTRRTVTSRCTWDAVRAPAWSDDRNIWFNLSMMREEDFVTTDGLIGTYGLFYHEMCHLLFTPRKNTWLREQILARPELHTAWNILEDQRIERLMCGQFTSCRLYLSAVVMRYILENKSEEGLMYPLAAGRYHVPKKVRVYLRSKFVRKDLIREIKHIISQYLDLVHPADDTYAIRLVQQFHDVLKEINPPPDYTGHGDRPTMGGATTSKAQEDARDAAADRAMPNEDTDEPANGSADGTPSDDGDFEELERLISNAQRMTRQSVSDDTETILDDMRRVTGVSSSRLPFHWPMRYELPGDDLVHAAQQFGDVLRALQVEIAPGWERRHSTGRINAQRLHQSDDYDTVFDQWSPGHNDALSFEVGILGDLSFSMNKNDMHERMAHGMWAIRRGFDLLEAGGIACTTLGYSSDADNEQWTLVQRGVPANPISVPIWKYVKNTDPSAVLTEMRHIFAGSTAVHQVVFILTDGAWDDHDGTNVPHESSIQMMNEEGIVTVLVHMYHRTREQMVADNIDPDDLTYNDHGCLVHATMFDWTDLVAIARKVVTELMRDERVRGRV